jgi:hypothetical protein
VGLKGAGRYTNPGDGEPSEARRTSLDERSESSGIRTAGANEVSDEDRNEPRECSGRGLSRCSYLRH